LIEALTEIANQRPKDPIAFLTNYLQGFTKTESEQQARLSAKTQSSSKTNSTALLISNDSAGAQSLANGNLQNNIDGIDSISLNEDEEDDLPNPSYEDRDEHGQSMLHFACARSHRRGALMSMIEESKLNITYRDELYRTGRDVALQANQPTNAKEIDRYVISMAVAGKLSAKI